MRQAVLLTDAAVDPLAEQIGVTEVACVLLDRPASLMVWVPRTVAALVGQWVARSWQYQHSSSYMYALPVSGWMASEPSRQMWSAAAWRASGQNLTETFKALPVRSRAMRKASPTSSIGSMWLSSGDTSIAASAISRTAYRNDSRPGSPWAPYAE